MRPEVLIFVMDGCFACSELEPIAQRMQSHYASCIDTRFIDVDAAPAFADAMGIEETPTVIGVDVGKRPVVRMIGADGLPDRLASVYAKLIEGVSTCRIDPFRDV